MKSSQDPRSILVREKYFSLRPKALERWLWRQPLPPAAERVFWLHWEEGMRRGDWCSELSLRQVARESCLDASTVTRAYQALKGRGLIRREDPGRNPLNPFQQAIAITEVLLPRELLTQLQHIPNRSRRADRTAAATMQTAQSPTASASVQTALPPAAPAPVSAVSSLSRAESATLLGKLSEAERAAFFLASRNRVTSMHFDAETRFDAAEQAKLRELLATLATDSARGRLAPAGEGQTAVARAAAPLSLRRLSPLEAARLRRGIVQQAGTPQSAELFRQALWSVEEGALRRFATPLAINIALKKIREGQWSRPHRMPPNWLRFAAPETCSAA
ncbi:MAG: hypothetical protein JSS24_14945 [Proteobacteria bacterium]|nr:hypothetical protein [Pseudomonadota bacterium]